LKLFGDKTPRTTPVAKNEILQLLKCLRMARKAGVQRTASPIGEGSHTKISSLVSRIIQNLKSGYQGTRLSDSGYQVIRKPGWFFLML